MPADGISCEVKTESWESILTLKVKVSKDIDKENVLMNHQFQSKVNNIDYW